MLVSTYRQPRELELALAALCRQSQAPLEVLIGDDGSGEDTRELIERYRARAPFDLVHVWQTDRGYRKARIMNEAARRARGEQLVFLDGDTFPHRDWIGDHLASANDRRVLCGRRVKLGPEISPGITVQDIEEGRFDSAFSARLLRSQLAGDTSRLSLGVRLPRPLARALHPRAKRLMGVNFSLPKPVFVAVNGFNEEWEVYGREDLDLELRLDRAGYPRVALLNRAAVFHVHHPERERSEETQRLVEKAMTSTATRCDRGYDLEGTFNPNG